MFFYGFDMLYVILVLPAVIFALICQGLVSSTFKKYSQIPTRRGLTGEEAARLVCRAGDASGVTIEPHPGELTDHFDPKAGVIRLSAPVFGKNSVAAVGVAAHEAGHAGQAAQGYSPFRLRTAIVPVTQIASGATFPLVILGVVLSFPLLVNIGILCFGVATFFQLVTLPVEFNASRRAILALEQGNHLDADELAGARKVLTAAALTYVAALAVSLAQLLRLLLIRGRD